MIRRLFLILAILAVMLMPKPAHGRGGAHGGHQHRHHGHRFIGVIDAPFPYVSSCWEDGHWVEQLYMDRYGNSTYVPLWVLPHWGCWY